MGGIMSLDGGKYPFTEENINRSPEQHGVYELIQNSTTIYFGRAAGDGVTIRSRLQSHFRGDDGSCTQQATHYRREINDRPKSREKELLEEYERSHGQLPRCNERKE